MFAGLPKELSYKVNNHTYTDAMCYNFFKACSKSKEFQLTFCEPGNLRYLALCELLPSNLYPAQFYDNPPFRTVISYSEMPYINIFYKDGRHQLCTFEELNDYVLAKDTFILKEKFNDIDCMTLGIPEERIPKGFKVILSRPAASSSYEPVLYNDVLSGDLTIITLKDSDVTNSNSLLISDILQKCNQNNCILIVYITAESAGKSNIKKAVSQYFPLKSLSAKNVFVVGYNNRKEDYSNIRKCMQQIENDFQTLSAIYRNSRINDTLLKIQASCDNIFEKKQQILNAAQWRNSQHWNYVNNIEQYSQVLYKRLYEDLPKYVVKAKQMLSVECTSVLWPKIRIYDDHEMRAGVYDLLYSSVAAFIGNFTGAFEAAPYYFDVCKYFRMTSLNIDNIFKGVRDFSYITSQTEMSFYRIPGKYIDKLKSKLAEHIVFMLLRNIDEEVNRFFSRSRGIIDNNIDAFRKSSYIVPYDQIQNDMNNLKLQKDFFRSLMG